MGRQQSVRLTALLNIKAELLRIAGNGTREGFKFAVMMFAKLPELKNL